MSGWEELDCDVPCGCWRCKCPNSADLSSPAGRSLCGCCIADCPDRHPETA